MARRVMFEGKLRTLSEVARMLGFAPSSISKWMYAHPGKTPEEAVVHFAGRSGARTAVYQGERLSFVEIAQRLGRTANSINRYAGCHANWTAQRIADEYVKRCARQERRAEKRSAAPRGRQEARARKLLGMALTEAEKVPLEKIGEDTWRYRGELLEWTAEVSTAWEDPCVLRCALRGRVVQEWKYFVKEYENKNGERRLTARKA